MNTPSFILSLLFFQLSVVYCQAQLVRKKPDEIREVGFENRIGEQLPLNVVLKDSKGNRVQLSKFFDSEKPVILAFHYSNCPMLCHLQLERLVSALQKLEMTVGVDFNVVAISIDASESPEITARTKQRHLAAYGRAESRSGWHFLTGSKQAIQETTDAAGFQFEYIPERKEYAHAAGIVVCTQAGIISRYLFGVEFPVNDLRLAILEAGEGRMSSAFDQLLMFCFHYDESAGTYSLSVKRITQIVCMCTLFVLTFTSLPYWLKSKR